MSTTITQYDPATGRATMWASVPVAMIHIQQDNIVVGRVDPATEYVLDRTIVARPACPAVLTGATLSALPAPCVLAINDAVYQCDDDHAELSLPPGEYRIKVSAWPYLDADFILRV